MKIYSILQGGLLLSALGLNTINAEIVRDPIGVNVSASKPMSLTVRFADANGAQFITTQAVFCYKLLANGQCDPGTMLGKLPPTRDRGSTLTPTSSITDVMTIPYSVVRSAVVRAQQVDYSDFFYVRRFTPVNGADLGAGPGQDVYSRVTCHLAGPATIPLSLSAVSLYGKNAPGEAPDKLIRLDQSNVQTGRIEARVEYTGTGILEGWWEIRRPGDPPLQDIDLLPEAALPDAERGLRQRFTRIKRFRVRATAAGMVVIAGPRYADLPQNVSGRHEILLRFDATLGRENRARLNIPGERRNLFSGAVAGFKIRPLEYISPAGLRETALGGRLRGRLMPVSGTDAEDSWHLVWKPQKDRGLALQLKIGSDQANSEKSEIPEETVVAPAHSGLLRLLPELSNSILAKGASIRLLGADGEPVTLFENVLPPQSDE